MRTLTRCTAGLQWPQGLEQTGCQHFAAHINPPESSGGLDWQKCSQKQCGGGAFPKPLSQINPPEEGLMGSRVQGGPAPAVSPSLLPEGPRYPERPGLPGAVAPELPGGRREGEVLSGKDWLMCWLTEGSLIFCSLQPAHTALLPPLFWEISDRSHRPHLCYSATGLPPPPRCPEHQRRGGALWDAHPPKKKKNHERQASTEMP